MRRATLLTRRVGRFVGRRGAFLVFLALLDLVLGYGLTQPLPLGLKPRTIYGPMMDLAPIRWWAIWWVLTGLLCLVGALADRVQTAAFVGAAVIKTAWACCYLVGWREHLPAFNRGWQSAAIFGAFAGVVLLISGWQENRR